jgi:hypothetical protein
MAAARRGLPDGPAPMRIHYYVPLVLLAAASSVGCGHHWRGSWQAQPLAEVPLIENPLFAPVADSELVWSQVVDTLDNHFRIRSEQRVQWAGDVPLEGRLETFPSDGSTLLEPWRSDSSPGYEKVHATLQSLRRQASVRVTPAAGGYLIEVVVVKELEDAEYPEYATAGTADGIRAGRPNDPRRDSESLPVTLGWIPAGRDIALEQRLLGEIRDRLTGIERG